MYVYAVWMCALLLAPCVSSFLIRARRSFPSEAGQPMPRAEILFDSEGLGLSRDQVLAQLREGEPSIALAAAGESGVYLNPQTLEPGQEGIIVARIKQIVGS